jgi:hypothetical protein
LYRTTDTRLPGADQRFPPGMQRRVGDGLGHQTGAVGVDEGGGGPAVGARRAAAILLPSENQRGSSSDRIADTARWSRRVGREDVSAVSGRSNRLGGLDPSRSLSILPSSAGSRRPCPRSWQGAVGPIRARAATHGRIENCGQPQAHLEATSDVSARRRIEACRRAKPVQRRKEECTGQARRDALWRYRQEQRPCPPAAASPDAFGGWSARAFRPDSNQTMTSARQDAEQRLKGGPCRCDRYHVGSPPQR